MNESVDFATFRAYNIEISTLFLLNIMIKHTFYREVVIIKSNKCVICRKEKEHTYERFCNECAEDNDKLKKYYDKLEKRRKYTKGELITSLDELLKQEFIYFYNKIYHIGWVGSWQLNFVKNQLNRNVLYKAIKKDSLKTPLE